MSWFAGSSGESIERACRAALDLGCDAQVRARDSDGCVVALNEFIPEGLDLEIEALGDESRIFDEGREYHASDHASDEAATLIVSDDFRGQLLKFERISAHLANERTWLAWARTSLSLVSCGFTLLSEAKDHDNAAWRLPYFALGCLFFACVDLTWLTGYLRYRQNKALLLTPKQDLFLRENLASKTRGEKAQHHPTGFSLTYQAHFLAAILLSTLLLYVASGARELF